jgi:site-specific recombinase XerD
MMQKLQKRLGLKLKRCGSHVLRHACVTHLLAQGLTLKEVATARDMCLRQQPESTPRSI